MAGPVDRAGDAALWRRWRALAGAEAGGGVAPDPLRLAAYAEGGLDEAACEAVERWLADHPEAIADVLAAREAGAMTATAAPEPVVARAMALVATPEAQVVRLRPRLRAPLWRVAVAWSGLAASILATSLVGFAMGSDAYTNFVGGQASSGFDLLDPPGGIFTSFGEESST